MKRISTNLPNYDTQYWLRLREWSLNEQENKIASQSRIQNLRDDPIAAGHSTRYQSEVARMTRWRTNVDDVRGGYAVTEGYLTSAMDILQRLRELAVQGANGVYDKSQLGDMGTEVDQLFRELIAVGNAKDQNGNYIFSGTQASTQPFRTSAGRIPGGAADVTVAVDFMASGQTSPVEVGNGEVVQVGFPGSQAFWAEQQQIYSTVDASTYRVQVPSTISLDGAEITLAPGDTVNAVIQKINDSNAPVRARLDPVSSSLVLETTRPHQIQAQDLGGSTVLQDLGIIARGSPRTPLNISPTARVFGGSIFDMVMQLRDALFAGDTDKVGSLGLKGVDESISSLAGTLADLGAKDNRVDTAGKRLDWVKPEVVAMDSKERDLDLSQAITELKMLEYGHEAALATAAQVLPPTLLDFLR